MPSQENLRSDDTLLNPSQQKRKSIVQQHAGHETTVKGITYKLVDAGDGVFLKAYVNGQWSKPGAMIRKGTGEIVHSTIGENDIDTILESF